MTVTSQRHSVLLDNVFALIDKKVDTKQKSLVQQFGRLLYKNISSDDLENRNDSDLYGATLSLWNGLAKFEHTSPYAYLTRKLPNTAGTQATQLLRLLCRICHSWLTRCACC